MTMSTVIGILCALAALWYAGCAVAILIQDSDEDYYAPHVLGLSTWTWRHIGVSFLLALASGIVLALPALSS